MSKDKHQKLFSTYDLASILENNKTSIKAQVEALPGKKFLTSPASDIVAMLVAENSIPRLRIHEHLVVIQPPVEYTIEAPRLHFTNSNDKIPQNNDKGFMISIELPYSGEQWLWQCHPESLSYERIPDFVIEKNKIVREYIIHKNEDPHLVRAELMNHMRIIRECTDLLNEKIADYEEQLLELIEDLVAERRNKIQKLELFGKSRVIPLKAKDEAMQFGTANSPLIFHGSQSDSEDNETMEAAIAEDDFHKILRVIRHTGCSFEKTPKVFRIHNENELRDIVQSSLNTHFEDNTGNEIFNKEGSCGFSISRDGKKAFLGVCKIWNSEQQLLHTLSRVLECTAWQNCKATLLIFNRDCAEFDDVRKRTIQLLKTHDNLISFDKSHDNREWHFTMRAANDKNLKVSLRLMLFNLFAEEMPAKHHLTRSELDFLLDRQSA